MCAVCRAPQATQPQSCRARPAPGLSPGGVPALIYPPDAKDKNQAHGSLFLLCTSEHPCPLLGDPSLCFFPPQPALCLAMAAPVAAAAKLRVHVGCGFRQVGLDQQTVKLVCTNRRKQFLLDTADVALAE